MVNEDYTSSAEAVLHHLNTVQLVDSYGALKRELPGTIISDSLKSDQRAPYPNSKVYYLTAKLAKIRYRYDGVYALETVNSLKDTGISFKRFLEMSLVEREKLRIAHEKAGM
jgi:hypothetical protein